MKPCIIEIFTDSAGKGRWRLVSPNNQILASCCDPYSRVRDARRIARKLAKWHRFKVRDLTQ